MSLRSIKGRGGRSPLRSLHVGLLAITLSVSAVACGGDVGGGAVAGSGKGEIKIWAHQGAEAEVAVLQQTVEDFNASQSGIEARLQLIPEADYTKTIAATSPDELPDVMEFDGPIMSTFVYDGKLAPLGDFASSETIDDQTASVKTQNTYPGDEQLYGLSMFDSGLGMFGNKELLDAAGVTAPTSLDDAWSAEEFQSALERLAAEDADGKVLDIKENYGAEWPTYGFLPIVSSAGKTAVADGKADGNLNSPEVVAAVEQFAGWRQYVDANVDDKAFTDGRVALSWVGHWVYPGYADALGQNLVVLPLPDFGNGPKSGQGSWAWGIGAGTKNGLAAGKFLDFLLADERVKAMTDANAAPPGTTSVTETSPLYKQGGPLELFAEELVRTCGSDAPTPDCIATPRPRSPAYPVISLQFSQAFFNVYRGGDAQEELDKAAAVIDQDYEDNAGYED